MCRNLSRAQSDKTVVAIVYKKAGRKGRAKP